MSFQQTLDLDEAFALLDGFDLVTSAAYESAYCTTSPSNSSPSTSGHESLADSDDALLSLLTDTGLASHCDIVPRSPQHTHHNELPSLPPAQRGQPQSNKKKATTAASIAATAAAAIPAGFVKRPRKVNRLEILKLRHELEELQVQHSSLQMTQKRPRTAALARQPTTTSTITGHATVGSGAPRSLWLEHAIEQHRVLQQSETLNRKLRDAVAQQLKMTNLMQALFQKKVPNQVRVRNRLLIPRDLLRYRRNRITHL